MACNRSCQYQETLLLRSLLQGRGKRKRILSTSKTKQLNRCHNSKVLESEDISQILCQLLKLHAALEVDIRRKYLMALFKEVVESKIDDPRGRLTRLIKCTTGDAKELIKHCIQLPSNEGFKNVKYLLEKVYGNPHKIFVSYRREIKQWPQIKFGDAKGIRKFHNFLLRCGSVLESQRWNALETPDKLCIMISKLPGRIMKRWNRSIPKIRRHQHREPNLKDITEFVEDETILIKNPLFFCEALGKFNTRPERHSRQQNTNSFVVKSEDGADEKDVRTFQGEKKLENWQLCNRHNDLDEWKAFNDMVVAERSKFLAKQKCGGGFERISAKHTARNCPNREHVRSFLGNITRVYMISSTKRKVGQQKIIPIINKSLWQTTVLILMTSSVNQLVLKMFLARVWFD